jgi:Spy/CpxP family protein refolding chaperone
LPPPSSARSSLLAPAASAQGFKWWQSEMFKRELGLTADQSAKIEAIFQKTVPVLRQEKDALDRRRRTSIR